jgi:polyisoprenoid-binding protein YceI
VSNLQNKISFKSFAVAAVVAISSLGALSVQAQAPKIERAYDKQPAGEYILDRAHASVIWRVSHLGLSNYSARFDKMDGKLNFTPATITQSNVEFSIDAASVNTGLAPFDKKLAGDVYFSAEKNPKITFKSNKIEPSADGKFRMTGDLTLRGVTKPATWDVTFNGGLYNSFAQAHAIGFSAKTTLKRSQFGMTELVPVVGDDVEVLVEVEFLNRAANTPK